MKRLTCRPIARRVRIDAGKLDELETGNDPRDWEQYALELDRMLGLRP